MNCNHFDRGEICEWMFYISEKLCSGAVQMFRGMRGWGIYFPPNQRYYAASSHGVLKKTILEHTIR
jgi:hypothetical protein